MTIVIRTCEVTKGNGHICGKFALSQFEDQWVCGFHHSIKERARYKNHADILWGNLSDEFFNNTITTEEMVDQAEQALTSGYINYTNFRGIMRMIGILGHQFEEPENHPPQGLAALAADSQSVHTSIVSEQTNRGLEVLLKHPVPEDHDTIAQLPLVFREDKQVMRDMQRWYKQTFCKDINDSLYRKVLDGLWCLIQTRPEKDELIQRLYEEARESLSMCCEGHLSRLCNVMVGFDDRFEPPVPVGEILQQKIASIANEEMSVEDKVERAVYVFRELQIPMDEWDVWVDAF
jgi:hypothetical protein